jgi:NAD(P)H-flavin reductase
MARVLIQRIWNETPRLQGALLDAPKELADLHALPGQFIVAHGAGADGAKKVYLVLASMPRTAPFELLLGESAKATLGLEPGREVEIDPPAGKGYPMDALGGRDVLLFSAGSALASLKPVISLIRAARSNFGRVTLFAGAHTADGFPYAAEFEDWKRDRIDVIRSVSRPWVQDRFLEEKLDVSNSAAFVCGGKQMMNDVTGALLHTGIPPDRIHRNF